MATEKKAKRTEFLKIRIEPGQRNLIDTAAAIRGKTRSAFVLDSAQQAAEAALLEQRVFVLSEEQWLAFNEALNAPPQKNEALAKMLNARTPWE